MNICDYIANNARYHPDKPAIVEQGRTLTYRELDLLVRRTASHLRALGVTQGARAALCLKDDADHLIVLLGVVRIGAVAIVFDWRAPIAERKRLAAVFDPSLVLYEADMAPPSDTHNVAVDDTWHEEVARIGPTDRVPHDGSLPLGILATSGTTGRPKGLVVTHDQTFARFVSSWLGYGWRRGDTYFSATPFTFAVGREYPIFHLIAGNTIVMHPSIFRLSEYVEAVNRSKATVVFAVPAVIRSMLDIAQDHPLLPHLRVLCVAGDRFYPDEKNETRRLISPHLHEVYGTAGIGAVSVLTPAEMAAHAGTVGRPLPTVEIEIVNADDRPCAADVEGVLRCRGNGLASGFYGKGTISEESGECFRNGWYYPGDRGLLAGSGHLALLGRRGDVIIRDGANINIWEVEAVLRGHSGVADVAVIGCENAEHGQDVAAVIVPRGQPTQGDLLKYCRVHLAGYKIPARIVFVDSLPKGPSGKTMRQALASLLPSPADK